MRKSGVLSIDPGDESATVDCQALTQIVDGLARSGRTVDRDHAYYPDARSRAAHPAGLPVRPPEASSRRALQLVH